ncbi:biotin--[acetyl-CoA-carboxylase] ligase [Anaerobacillus sp. MEB173]|uniref:biotin--[acetyl-CoA-carboxylase] ligase n=1 Tax=Anaerobacillus sp. MEB173 TaxID=3383345 RepID=UPI003F8EDFD0
MRGKLLQMLLEHEGQYVSGEKISQHLGCSRTAVWKHIEELRKSGYELEAAPRRGYRIVYKPNTISEHEIKAELKTKALGQEIVYKDSLVTTQEVAHRLAGEGAIEGTVVVADEQTGGKGRLGREWYSPKGSGLWMSIILKPEIPPQQAPQLTLLAAAGVVRGIQKATGLDCEIKWPNDILFNGKKIVGILTEMQSEPDRIHSVIVGIGINVNQRIEHFPEELQQIATSLAIETGQEVSRTNVMKQILEEIEGLYYTYLKKGFTPIKEIWESFAVSLGKLVRARTIQGVIEGVAKGITDDGVLLLEDEKGEVHKIYSADIEINITKS